MKTWKAKVQDNYSSLSELQHYDSIYNIVSRCGFHDAETMWRTNPVIGGSTNPADFGLVEKGETVPLEPVSGWAHTASVQCVECPHCKAQRGHFCRTPKGRKAREPHWQRGAAYIDSIGKAEFDKRHSQFYTK